VGAFVNVEMVDVGCGLLVGAFVNVEMVDV